MLPLQGRLLLRDHTLLSSIGSTLPAAHQGHALLLLPQGGLLKFSLQSPSWPAAALLRQICTLLLLAKMAAYSMARWFNPFFTATRCFPTSADSRPSSRCQVALCCFKKLSAAPRPRCCSIKATHCLRPRCCSLAMRCASRPYPLLKATRCYSSLVKATRQGHTAALSRPRTA